MARTIRGITVERGRDPRSFALVAFGGAGPLHAADLADMLSIPEVLIPPHPGITSATGLLTSELRYDVMSTVLMVQGAIDGARIDELFAQLTAVLLERLQRDGADPAQVRVERSLDCRYVGQGYELRIPFDGDAFAEAALERFHAVHEQEYGRALADPIEIVNVRVRAAGDRPRLTRIAVGAGDLASATIGEATSVWDVGGVLADLPTRRLLRERLPVGEPIDGPAVIFQRDTTIVVPPSWRATADPGGPLLLSAVRTTQEGRR
jgi:N-methylhydantoinase A